MPAYFLKSPRIGFRAWSADDLPLAIGLWSDADVTRYHGGAWSTDQIEAFLAAELEALKRHGVQYWALFSLQSGEHLGCCGIRRCRGAYGEVNEVGAVGEWELGCHLRRPFWSLKLGREAAQAVISHSFDVLHVQTLRAGHHPGNEASRRFLQHLGFRYTHDEFFQPAGLMEPRYRLTSDTWGSGRR